MARQVSLNTVQFYRALVEVKRGDQWGPFEVFGPYASRSACVDRDARWYRDGYKEGRRRVTRQKLVPVSVMGLLALKWVNADE